VPELPEVETIRRQLLPIYQSEVFAEITFSENAASLLQNCDVQLFCAALPGKSIADLQRTGKYLLFDLTDIFPVFHLGMSGIFLQEKSHSRYPRHVHVSMHFESGKHLYFQDMRRFGKIWLYQQKPRFDNLGVDPINGGLTLKHFQEILQKRDMNIKLFLMDQHKLAGIGNIYASEILFDAAISPFRKTGDLQTSEIQAMYAAIHRILNAAIDRFGTTYSAYRTVTGQAGENQNFLKVYQRGGLPCYQCGQEIIKTMLGNRSTFYCENCQN